MSVVPKKHLGNNICTNAKHPTNQQVAYKTSSQLPDLGGFLVSGYVLSNVRQLVLRLPGRRCPDPQELH